MSVRFEATIPVPEETAQVARAAFPKGNRYLEMRDVLGPIYDDQSFAPLFSPTGRPAEAPWRLALITVMQFSEGLSDRQAADAVRARIDGKYSLSLPLSDPGFHYSVLSEFRRRLVSGQAEHLLLDTLLAACSARGLLAARGQQRTDPTGCPLGRILMSVRALNRLERVSETLRHALNALAEAAPDWLRTLSPTESFARYSHRVEAYRLPRGKEARQQYAETVGVDGMRLFAAVYAPDAPAHARRVPAVDLLRQVWITEYEVVAGQVRLRATDNMPPVSHRIDSPYDPQARFCVKRATEWSGDKAHVTESCDDALPHLITHVETTAATEPDVNTLDAIHAGLAAQALLPAQHLVDAGYPRGQNLVTARRDYQVDVLGPVYTDRQWHAQDGTGDDVRSFAIDWAARVVTCPQGQRSIRWSITRTARQRTMIPVDFAKAACAACPVRALCPRATTVPRTLTLQPQAEHEAIEAARQRQETPEFATAYLRRAGIEGTLSQGVRVCGLRAARYRGLAKTHLQHVATAAGLNVLRLGAWWQHTPPARTRRSRFAALDPAA
jgi:transposase